MLPIVPVCNALRMSLFALIFGLAGALCVPAKGAEAIIGQKSTLSAKTFYHIYIVDVPSVRDRAQLVASYINYRWGPMINSAAQNGQIWLLAGNSSMDTAKQPLSERDVNQSEMVKNWLQDQIGILSKTRHPPGLTLTQLGAFALGTVQSQLPAIRNDLLAGLPRLLVIHVITNVLQTELGSEIKRLEDVEKSDACFKPGDLAGTIDQFRNTLPNRSPGHSIGLQFALVLVDSNDTRFSTEAERAASLQLFGPDALDRSKVFLMRDGLNCIETDNTISLTEFQGNTPNSCTVTPKYPSLPRPPRPASCVPTGQDDTINLIDTLQDNRLNDQIYPFLGVSGRPSNDRLASAENDATRPDTPAPKGAASKSSGGAPAAGETRTLDKPKPLAAPSDQTPRTEPPADAKEQSPGNGGVASEPSPRQPQPITPGPASTGNPYLTTRDDRTSVPSPVTPPQTDDRHAQDVSPPSYTAKTNPSVSATDKRPEIIASRTEPSKPTPNPSADKSNGALISSRLNALSIFERSAAPIDSSSNIIGQLTPDDLSIKIHLIMTGHTLADPGELGDVDVTKPYFDRPAPGDYSLIVETTDKNRCSNDRKLRFSYVLTGSRVNPENDGTYRVVLSGACDFANQSIPFAQVGIK